MSDVIHVDTKEKLLEIFGNPDFQPAGATFDLVNDREPMRHWNTAGDASGLERIFDPDLVTSWFGKRKPHIRSIDDDWLA